MTQKSELFLNKKIIKLTENMLFNGFTSNYNAGILTFFNPELQLKDTEFAMKNKLRKYYLR